MEKCSCITDINTKLKEAYGDEKARLVTVLCLSNNQLDAYPALSATYHPTKKDGSFGKEKTISIRPSFCPFCGKKYFDD
jgi:hypothetical protein